jgi:hypothetical protein
MFVVSTLSVFSYPSIICFSLDAENAINRTMANVYIDVDQNNIINRSDLNMTCASLKFCHDRGQCIIVDNQLKCL